ncbi:zinc finger protein 347-like [Ruditapes philippinarum]|uniref:zinc finger protein 347-like n=1 Tax=Ruditapes philippinarum TaxID=129788 RepID=UPI00295B403C|nr:zinc finger protein 347-like [Ruditapes philippinarum]
MEDLMSGFLSMAAGKDNDDEFVVTISDHVSGMISDEIIHREVSPQSDDDEVSTSICSDNYTNSTETENDYPSYESLYGGQGYSSSPTYIRSDFYSMSPPPSPPVHITTADDNLKSKRHLPFSIDSIIGTESSNCEESSGRSDVHVPAQVSSSHFSADDTINHHPMNVCESESMIKCVFWCHVCDDVCSDLTDACIHQDIHIANRDQCRLQDSYFSKSGHVTKHELIVGFVDKVKCGLCEEIVTYRFLQRHLQRHESHVRGNSCHGSSVDQRNPAIYQCSLFFRCFRSRHAQTIHQQTHNKVKPCMCYVPGCFKTFSQLLDLQLHLKFHRGYGDIC